MSGSNQPEPPCAPFDMFPGRVYSAAMALSSLEYNIEDWGTSKVAVVSSYDKKLAEGPVPVYELIVDRVSAIVADAGAEGLAYRTPDPEPGTIDARAIAYTLAHPTDPAPGYERWMEFPSGEQLPLARIPWDDATWADVRDSVEVLGDSWLLDCSEYMGTWWDCCLEWNEYKELCRCRGEAHIDVYRAPIVLCSRFFDRPKGTHTENPSPQSGQASDS